MINVLLYMYTCISRDQLLPTWISKGTFSFPTSGHVIMIGPGIYI